MRVIQISLDPRVYRTIHRLAREQEKKKEWGSKKVSLSSVGRQLIEEALSNRLQVARRREDEERAQKRARGLTCTLHD